MTNKILELTEKIYNEGIVKAKHDAEQIVAEAKKEANEILKLAKKQELEILKQAKEQSEELQKNTNSELQLATRQFMSKLKQQISSLITTAQVVPPVETLFNDTEFIKKIILIIIQNWNPQKPEELDLRILLSENHRTELTQFFENRGFDALNKGLEFDFDSKTKNGFKIGPKDGSYIIRFSATDFENYFMGYFKERTRKLLFDSSQ